MAKRIKKREVTYKWDIELRKRKRRGIEIRKGK
jgi:hypothetical protein